MTSIELWNQLSEVGLVTGELPPVTASGSQSPWPVRLMLGFAGWLGALFLLGFAGIALASLFRTTEAALLSGALCCLAAYAIFRLGPHNDFVGQLALAVSIAGQGLLFVGLAKPAGGILSESGPFFGMAVIEAVLAVAIPNYVHRVFTTIAANFCLFIAAGILGVPALASAVAAAGVGLIWLNPAWIAQRPSLWQPLGYGFAIGLLHVDGSLVFGSQFWTMIQGHHEPAEFTLRWLGPLLAGLVFVYAVWRLRNSSPVILAAAAVLALCGIAAPGVSAAVLVLTLGFANTNRILMGLGLLAFGCYLSLFYYQLNTTLLVKSIVLTATGAALLLLRYWLQREEVAHE